MIFSDYLPFWDKLSPKQKDILNSSVTERSYKKGELIHSGSSDCMGLILVCSGQIRAYIFSPEGKEVTIYRLFERDICLFSASCMMNSIQFDITLEAEKDTVVTVIPPKIYKMVMEESAVVANYTNEVMASRFSDVMWLIDQIMWKSFDSRLAGFLLEETALEGTNTLHITHEIIGNHLGSPREVVTRMLKYFQTENIVKLARSTIEITDINKLRAVAEKN